MVIQQPTFFVVQAGSCCRGYLKPLLRPQEIVQKHLAHLKAEGRGWKQLQSLYISAESNPKLQPMHILHYNTFRVLAFIPRQKNKWASMYTKALISTIFMKTEVSRKKCLLLVDRSAYSLSYFW